MEDEATLRSGIKSNKKATRVMRHKWPPDSLSRVCTGPSTYVEAVNPQALESSSLDA